MMKVITRYPPSPTGEIHIGNMRTMLFNYLFAKQNNGQIVLRFEDTDKERSDAKYEQIAIDSLHLLGLSYDSGPFRQTERTAIYTKHLKSLIDQNLAYEAEESQDGSGNNVIRFKNPNKVITFTDRIRGEISIDTTDFEDFVIARSIDNPIYHFTVVVDDMEMGVTHIIRGEDHITSTPRQILLIEALGGLIPEYAHLPLIVGEDKKKLSKRHGAVTVTEFIRQGYLPEGIVNYLSLLGWNPGDEREIFTLEELVGEFSLERVHKNPAMFSYEKLDDINKQHIMRLSTEDLTRYVLDFLPEQMKTVFESQGELSQKIITHVIAPRIKKFSDVSNLSDEGEFDCFFTQPALDYELMRFKESTDDVTKKTIAAIVEKLELLPEEQWSIEEIKSTLWDWSGEVGRGSALHPMRTCLSGMKQSPDPFTLAYILGKTETLTRLKKV